jgi:hypothetical protein
MTPEGAYNELCCHTLAHHHPSFIHQYGVDAFAAQHADNQTKPMKLAFALVGLYLHVEKQFSGKQVQRVHMDLARQKRRWPSFALPAERGDLTAAEVLAVPAGPERDKAIDAWCASVWEAFRDCRPTVVELLREHGIVLNGFGKSCLGGTHGRRFNPDDA